jgi:putative ABC transport system permease protein
MRTFSLSRRNLAANPLRSLLTASAIALGVAMLLAASILIQATTRSAHQLASQESALDLQLFQREDALFNARLSQRITALPGVEAVVLSLDLQAVPQGLRVATLSLKGVEPQYAGVHALALSNGVFLDRPDSLVLPEEIASSEGLSPGDHLTLSLGGRSLELTVSGVVTAASSGSAFAFSQNLAAYLPLDAAQALAGSPGQVSRLDISLADRADINQVGAEILRLAGDDFVIIQTRMPVSFTVMDVLVQGLLGLVGVMILFASAFVISNAFAMAVAGRRREIGALRCLGMTRHQVFRNTLAEAATLALAGTLVGVLLGVLLGWAIQQIMGTLDQISFALPWWGLVFSPLIGLLVTLAGALEPAWQAQRISPLDALRNSVQPLAGLDLRRRSCLGWIVLALTLVGLALYSLLVRPDFIVGTGGLALGMVGIILAVILGLPGLMSPLAKLFRPLASRHFGMSGRLAVDGISRNPARSAATVMGLAIGPAIVIFMTGVMSLLFAGFFLDQSSMVHEDATIGLDLMAAMENDQLSVDNFAAYMLNQPPLDPQFQVEMEAFADREGFELLRYGLLRLPQGGLPPMNAVALADLGLYTRIGNFNYFNGDRQFTFQQMQHGPVILLSPGDAARQGVGLGDAVSLPTSQGAVDFYVAGIGGNNLYMSFIDFNDGRRYFDIKGPTSLGVILPANADRERIFVEVESLLEGYPMLVLNRDLDEAVNAAAGMLGAFQALLDGLMLLAVLIASLGVVNTITLTITERGRELGMLRAVGATRRQVLHSVAGEAAVLGLAAAVLAAGLSLLLVGAFLLVSTPNGYYSMGVIFQWDTLLPALGKMSLAILIGLLATPLVAALAAWLPARRAARLNVIEATRSEQLSLKTLTSRHRPTSHLPHSNG